MRSKFLSYSLLVVLLLQSSRGHVVALAAVETPSEGMPSEPKNSVPASSLAVDLSTPTGKSIIFKPQEQEAEVKAGSTRNEIPHLVLHRNGVPTPGFERTLQVSVGNLSVPRSGMYVQLEIETQHGDPDLDRRNNIKIRVWKENRFVPYNALTQQGIDVRFDVTFNPITELPHKTIKTPTDYYRYRITVTDALGNELQTYVHDYAFLMENQWRVPLPQVLEMTPGAAPDELLVYYYDMIPFQPNLKDPDSQIPREEVDRYIQTELIPAMVEAFRQQSDLWGFPWYEEWRNYRSDEDPKTLSVALGEREIWFHGEAPELGHSMISIRVDGTAGEYDNLTDGLMSTFHHELFHNQQRNMSLHFGSDGLISGKEEAWKPFSEGTAVFASSVGQPSVQFEATTQLRSYLKRANAFIGSDGALGGGLNKSYKEIPYHTAIYWRFLYERCGGLKNGIEDPSTGMQVIREALRILYQGEIVDINSSTDLTGSLPRILDIALKNTPSCEFQTHEESLIHFARAIYMLRLENGRCSEKRDFSTCGLFDPFKMYATPNAENYSVTARSSTQITGSVPSSFGVDLFELDVDDAAKDTSLKIIFENLADSESEFRVEVWNIRAFKDEFGEESYSVPVGDPLAVRVENGYATMKIDNLARNDFSTLGLVIIRMDRYEEKETTGAYSIQVIAE